MQENKIDEVSDLAVCFRPTVVFDGKSYSAKGFSTKSRAPMQDSIIIKTFIAYHR